MADQDYSFAGQCIEGVAELPSIVTQVEAVLAKGERQSEIRDGVVGCVNSLCDALQLASDIVSTEISETIRQLNASRGSAEKTLEALTGIPKRFSHEEIGRRLKQGHVCAELHKLHDRFSTPLSKESLAGLSAWDTVRTFFGRSNRMSAVLQGLHEGEASYLHDTTGMIQQVIDDADALATRLSRSGEIPQPDLDKLVDALRQRRQLMQGRAAALRREGDRVVATLH